MKYRADKIKKLIAKLKLGHDLTPDENVQIKPVTMEMILGYDEMQRQKLIREAGYLIEKQLTDIKERILKTREIGSKEKKPDKK